MFNSTRNDQPGEAAEVYGDSLRLVSQKLTQTPPVPGSGPGPHFSLDSAMADSIKCEDDPSEEAVTLIPLSRSFSLQPVRLAIGSLLSHCK
jgi:hypothetical protein